MCMKTHELLIEMCFLYFVDNRPLLKNIAVLIHILIL